MPKIRGIKPEFWTDESMVQCSMEARLFFIGLWNFCDDWGVFEYKPVQLKMLIFPNDEVDVHPLLHQLERGQIVRFEHEGKAYGWVRNFHRHQRPDKRFFRSLIPDFPKVIGMEESRYLSAHRAGVEEV